MLQEQPDSEGANLTARPTRDLLSATTKSALTPGPWKVVDQHPNRSCIQVLSEYREVAVLYGVDGDKDTNGVWRNDHMRMANARLIAEAPALLFALRQIVNDLPQKRDWLDPALESLAREVLAACEAVAGEVPSNKTASASSSESSEAA